MKKYENLLNHTFFAFPTHKLIHISTEDNARRRKKKRTISTTQKQNGDCSIVYIITQLPYLSKVDAFLFYRQFINFVLSLENK